MISIGKLENQMQNDTRNNLCEPDVTDVPNNEKTVNFDYGEKSAIEITYNNFARPIIHDKECDAARDGKCYGEIKKYGHSFFNCLLGGEYHSFCKYHYDNATYCPVHPTFNRVL